MWGSIASLAGLVFNIISLFTTAGNQTSYNQQTVQVQGNKGNVTVVQGDRNTIGGRMPEAQSRRSISRYIPAGAWGVALIGFIILWIFTHTMHEKPKSAQEIGPINDNYGQIVVVQGSHNKIEAIASEKQGIKTETVDMIVSRYEETIADRDIKFKEMIYEKERKIRELNNGLARVKKEADAGNAIAIEALKSARESGNLDQVQNVLIAIASKVDKEGNSKVPVDISREIAIIAFMRGDYDEASNRLQYILAAEPNDVISLSYKARIYLIKSDVEKAEIIYHQIEMISPADPEAQCVALGNIANIESYKGDVESAEKTHEKVLGIAQNNNLSHMAAMAQMNLGLIHREQEKYDQAEVEIQAAVTAFDTLSMQAELSKALCALAQVNSDKKKTEDALELVSRAKNLKIIANMPVELAYCYDTEGVIYMDRKEYELAAKAYEEELRILTGIGYESEIYRTHKMLAAAYYSSSKYDKAAEHFKASISTEHQESNDTDATMYSLYGDVLVQQGKLDEAIQQYERCLSISRALNDLNTQLSGFRSLAACYIKRGSAPDALNTLKLALKISLKIGDEAEIAKDRLELAISYAAYNRLDDAAPLAKQVVAGLSGKTDPGFAARAHATLGEVFRMKRDYKESLEHLEKASALYVQTKESHYGVMLLSNMASSLMNVGEMDLAEKASNNALAAARLTADDENTAIALGNLASIYMSRDEDYETAESYALQALELNKKMNRVMGIAVNYVILARLYSARGDENKSLEYRKLIATLPESEISQMNNWPDVKLWLDGKE